MTKTQNLKQKKPPKTRKSQTHEFSIAGIRGYLNVGMYEDGTPCEIFINMSKEGSTISGLLDTIAISVSMGLQYGIPLEKFVKKFSWMAFEPSGFTGTEEYGYAKSIVDYIFRWLGKNFGKIEVKEEKHIDDTLYAVPESPKEESKESEKKEIDTPPCTNCGGLTKRSGACYCCTNCGETSGCS
jgi:ribonucleoside-diphosphate reductase alpha chain